MGLQQQLDDLWKAANSMTFSQRWEKLCLSVKALKEISAKFLQNSERERLRKEEARRREREKKESCSCRTNGQVLFCCHLKLSRTFEGAYFY